MDENNRKNSEKNLRRLYELYICNRENLPTLNPNLAEAEQQRIEQTLEFEELLDEETLIKFDMLSDTAIEERDEADYELFLKALFLGYHFGYLAGYNSKE